MSDWVLVSLSAESIVHVWHHINLVHVNALEMHLTLRPNPYVLCLPATLQYTCFGRLLLLLNTALCSISSASLGYPDAFARSSFAGHPSIQTQTRTLTTTVPCY